jgi:hypothetical protein
MGGKGSGRYPAVGLERRKPRKAGRIAQAARISERVLISTLADAEESIKNGQKPSAGVLDLARWAYEMYHGKATVALDVTQEVNHVLDPSLVMAAIAQAQADTLLLDAAWEPSKVSPNGLLDAPNADNPCSISQKSALANLPPERVSEREGSD